VKVEGEREFAAPRAKVWEVLNDPSRLAKTMPGVESFDIQDDRHWRANVKVPLGLGGLKMSIDFEKIEEREPEFAKLHAKGNGVGAIMNMDTAFHLTDADAGTHMKWEADVHILGPVASMGQRVLQPIVNQQVGSVLAALDLQVQEAAGSASRAAPATGAEDAGEPAEGPGQPEGSSGAEEGLSPLAPESYRPEAEGPTRSTEDS
jgi:carbon monoxide dehydrogenase subunit G